MYEFLSIVLIVFGVLQIILFFKMWGMTNDVNKIKDKLEETPREEDITLLKAQIYALHGDKKQSFELYQESFYKSVIDLFNKSITEYGDKDNLNYKERNEYYKSEYIKIVRFYNKRIEKLGMQSDTEKFDSYEKIYSYICES